jgi:sugar (pentulose or hexulose) kinase
MLLGIDIGTTHCKAGVFDAQGHVLRMTSRPTPTQSTPDGRTIYDPERLWQTAADAISAVAGDDIRAVGVGSMAETGALFDRKTGEARSPFFPWFDTAAAPQADTLKSHFPHAERFSKAGIRASYKCSIAKLLWLRDHGMDMFEGGIWLGAADYIVYRLTGAFATDYSLATRTYAFDIGQKRWDENWLRTLNLPTDLFPPAVQSGTTAGMVKPNECGLPEGIPATVAGHDHVCAALAVGAVKPGIVFDSMGTAESLVGTLDKVDLGNEALESGLSYGCHVAPDRYYWMGGITASGGSVEWLRGLLGESPLTYEQFTTLSESANPQPTGILYFPYLSGSGIPRPNPTTRASFIGLSAKHGRADMVKTVLEGTAYEAETMRRAAERVSGLPIDIIIVVGGGTRNRAWLQIKADVSGCQFNVYSLPDATLLGAALIGGIGAGIIDRDETTPPDDAFETISPDAGNHAIYRQIYEDGFLRLQDSLTGYFHNKDFM